MSKKTVYKQLAGMEDFAQGVGKVEQQRNGRKVQVGLVDLPYSVNSVESLKSLNTSVFTLAKLNNVVYEFSSSDSTGIVPDSGVGSWLPSIHLDSSSVSVNDSLSLHEWINKIEGVVYVTQGLWEDIKGKQVTESMRTFAWEFNGESYGVFATVNLPIIAPDDPTTQPSIWRKVSSGVSATFVQELAGYAPESGRLTVKDRTYVYKVPGRPDIFVYDPIGGNVITDDVDWNIFKPVTDSGVYHFSIFGGKCNGIDSDDDALDTAMKVLPKGAKLSFSGMGEGANEGLVLTRNHIYKRGDIVIDLANINVYWRAPTGYIPDRSGNFVSNYRSPGIICFRGELLSESYTATLTEVLPEFSEQFPVPGVSNKFTKGSWWIVTTDTAPGTTVGKEINYLIECQGDYGNPNQVRLNYRTGWPLEVGRKINYTKAVPVQNIHILNVGNIYYEQNITDGTGSGDEFTSEQACSLISFEIVRSYSVTGLKAHNQPYVAIFEQWVSQGYQKRCETIAPNLNRSDQVIGRNGALYCAAEDIFNKSGRHVCDHTSAAYCVVTSSRETGTKNGAFTHHGSFEHDIYYENTSGVLSIANSGAAYGESAKRINAKNHNGTQLIADKKVSECVFDTCTFDEFAKVNVDGITFINTNVPNSHPSNLGGLMFSQNSRRSGEGFKAFGGIFELSISTTAIPNSVYEDISFYGSTIKDFRARELLGLSTITFDSVTAKSDLRGFNKLGQSRTIISGGVWSSVPFKTVGNKDQYIALDGGYKANGAGDSTDNITWNFDKDSGGILEINIGDASFNDLGKGTKHFKLSAATGTLKYKSVGATYIGGEIEFQAATSNIKYLYHKANVEDGVTRSNVPTEAANISISDNMVV